MENAKTSKITLTESLLQAALVGKGWPKDMVEKMVDGFNVGGAKKFAEKVCEVILSNHSFKEKSND